MLLRLRRRWRSQHLTNRFGGNQRREQGTQRLVSGQRERLAQPWVERQLCQRQAKGSRTKERLRRRWQGEQRRWQRCRRRRRQSQRAEDSQAAQRTRDRLCRRWRRPRKAQHGPNAHRLGQEHDSVRRRRQNCGLWKVSHGRLVHVRGVHAVRMARPGTTGTTGTLRCRSARDEDDAGARDTRRRVNPPHLHPTRVNNVPNAGQRHRRLCHVSRHDDDTRRGAVVARRLGSRSTRVKHGLLRVTRKSGVQRKDLHLTIFRSRPQRRDGLVDLPRTGEEHEDTAGRQRRQNLLCALYGRSYVVSRGGASVVHRHRVRATLDVNDARLQLGGWKEAGVRGKVVNAQGGRHDDELERTKVARQPVNHSLARRVTCTKSHNAGQHAEQDVRVEGPLVRLVNDDGRVGTQRKV
mmetsp:Transcript_5678/g.18448  ORF Transcript_5678/g.18448 Transcript_5678/m.18448 type:complete len:408 (-) Transcript_5678:647-1870(-)